jgi:hypothetical protein
MSTTLFPPKSYGNRNEGTFQNAMRRPKGKIAILVRGRGRP